MLISVVETNVVTTNDDIAFITEGVRPYGDNSVIWAGLDAADKCRAYPF